MRSCAIVVILAVLGTALVTEAVIDSLTTMAPKWWDDYMLQNTLVVNEPRQYAPMLAKLDAGEPINVMVWGSSVVAGHAGCGFGRSGRTFIKKARGFMPGCEDRSWQGWGTLFMKWVNETWPSKQHMFANGGLGGAFLTTYVLSGCPEGTIPDPVDLVLLENLGGDTLTKHIEQVRVPARRRAGAVATCALRAKGTWRGHSLPRGLLRHGVAGGTLTPWRNSIARRLPSTPINLPALLVPLSCDPCRGTARVLPTARPPDPSPCYFPHHTKIRP